MIKLEPGEQILLKVRKHIFVFTVKIVTFFLIALIPLVFYTVGIYFYSELPTRLSYLLFFFYTIWLIFLWIFLFLAWTDHHLDIWVLTDRRLVDIEQKGIFSRDISSVHLDKIQDVRVEIAGFIPTLFKFGNVHVQTAGTSKEFVIRSAAYPEEVKEAITAAHYKKMEEIKTVRIAPEGTNMPVV